ncbi:MAG TPA: substrate-binding domain-containing protein, partial [Gaiellaceae bacterium]|nr:substrate-binding domain-containing protein [Gaiellaceae bacterium]
LDKIGKRWIAGGHVSGQLQLVAQGGATAAFLTSPTAKLAISSDSKLKQILGWSYINDGQPIVPRGIAVTRKAASPASARLFLDFVYSKAGQLAMCDAGFTAFMNGYTPADGCQNTLAYVTKQVGAKNLYNPGFTQKFVNDRPAFTKRWHSIFG